MMVLMSLYPLKRRARRANRFGDAFIRPRRLPRAPFRRGYQTRRRPGGGARRAVTAGRRPERPGRAGLFTLPEAEGRARRLPLGSGGARQVDADGPVLRLGPGGEE